MLARQTGDAPLILLIDDDPQCRRDLGEALEACGLRPLAAESGEKGLELLSQRDFAAVITDWQMPGLDGLGVAEAVRAANRGVPVVMITGAAEWAWAAGEARARGVCRCLRKPIDLRALLDCLRGVIELERSADHTMVGGPPDPGVAAGA